MPHRLWLEVSPPELCQMGPTPALKEALGDCPLARWADERGALANRLD